MTKLLIFILIFVLIIFFLRSIPCEEELFTKITSLNATRKQLGDAEQAVIECNDAIQAVENEIAKLRDIIIKKKVNRLRDCKTSFNEKIDTYKILFKAINDREATSDDINELKRNLGITI